MICKLCAQQKKLIKAHIIPEFMYKEIYDEDHLFYKLRLENLGKNSKIPTGEYDKSILCESCDNVSIGQLESYAAKVYEEGGGTNANKLFYQDWNTTILHVTNIDYEKFKLFLLSILWKSSMTKREFFKDVNLGPYENTIREMIINRDPKEQADFPCLMIECRADVPWTSQLITQPTMIKMNNRTVYRYLLNGIMYFYYIGEKITEIPNQILEMAISKTNEMRIISVQKGEGEKLLKSYLLNNKPR